MSGESMTVIKSLVNPRAIVRRDVGSSYLSAPGITNRDLIPISTVYEFIVDFILGLINSGSVCSSNYSIFKLYSKEEVSDEHLTHIDSLQPADSDTVASSSQGLSDFIVK